MRWSQDQPRLDTQGSDLSTRLVGTTDRHRRCTLTRREASDLRALLSEAACPTKPLASSALTFEISSDPLKCCRVDQSARVKLFL